METQEERKQRKRDNKLKKKINNALIDLAFNIKNYSYMVGYLTELDGNCIFSSILYFGYGNTSNTLRNAIALIMYEYRDYKGFIKKFPDNTLRELYSLFSTKELPKVLDKNKKIIEYNYNVMCKDLSNSGEWDRINTELLFLTLSRILDVEIIIYHDVDQTFKEYTATNKIYDNKIILGYVYECHYVPLIKITQGFEIVDTLQYEIQPK
jgi:hypothetical protein